MNRAPLFVVAGVLSGCLVCADGSEPFEFMGLRVCDNAPGPRADGGIPNDRVAWTWEGGRVAEPDRTLGEAWGPAIGSAGKVPPLADIDAFANSAAIYITAVHGQGCVRGEDGAAGRFFASWRVDGGELISQFNSDCHIKLRNGKSAEELYAEWLDRLWECAVSSGWGVRERPDGSWDFLSQARDEATFVVQQDMLFQCWAEECADINTWDGADDDGDGLNDTCDCEVLDPPAEEERDRQCWRDDVPNPGGLPGQYVCEPGEESKSCLPYVDTDRWMRDVVLGGLFEGDGMQADYAAAEIEYTFDDGLAPSCPDGANCEASRSRRRGKDYEKFICNRLLRRTNGNCECSSHPIPINRYPSYRAEEVCWTLPPDLPHDMGRRICRPAGVIRYPDYITRGEWHVAMGEAKCYDPIQPWNARDPWWWYRAASFGPQFMSYMRKVLASRRGGGPRYSINYHYCSAPPRWAAQLMAAGLAMDAGGNNFHLYINDNGGRQFINVPICFEDARGMAEGVAATLFSCFVPGEVAPEGVSPAWECTGAFYDHCQGSE